MKLSTRELLYLEDSSKVCESIVKACNHAANETQDQKLKSFYQSTAKDHQGMITASTTFIKQQTLQ
jgi:hypothetical protein